MPLRDASSTQRTRRYWGVLRAGPPATGTNARPCRCHWHGESPTTLPAPPGRWPTAGPPLSHHLPLLAQHMAELQQFAGVPCCGNATHVAHPQHRHQHQTPPLFAVWPSLHDSRGGSRPHHHLAHRQAIPARRQAINGSLAALPVPYAARCSLWPFALEHPSAGVQVLPPGDACPCCTEPSTQLAACLLLYRAQHPARSLFVACVGHFLSCSVRATSLVLSVHRIWPSVALPVPGG